MADIGDSLTGLTHSSSSGEQSWYEYTSVYLPVKLGNDSVVLVENGNISEIFNFYTGRLNTYPYPKNCKVPIEDLVIVVSESSEISESAMAKYEDCLMSGSKNCKEPDYTITHHSVEYFRWGGRKLVKVK